MLTTTFYKLLDGELNEILVKNPENQALHKHKDVKLNKGYAFMMWFLDFYGQKRVYQNYITDGPNDSSCDIIFSNPDIDDKDIFYITQSKWVNVDFNKPYPTISSQEFKATISDFTTVVNGTRELGKNEKFNQKYKDLMAHLQKNGKAKFVFFTAADNNNEIEDTIKSFKKESGTSIDFLLIDINRIKRDYIDLKIKELITENPLEYSYDTVEKEIILEIERNEDKTALAQDILQLNGREQAYTFLLKPKTIHALFKKFKFNLFFKNVRNPLHSSNYNEKIVETLVNRPSSFWYFNNGITAITQLIPDGIGKHAKSFTIIDLQIINGAQTIYSIYRAYEDASRTSRKIMDADARVSFRLIRSSDRDFAMEITRYTNQQNQMEVRDFAANLDAQERMQMESFKTNYWYEKRRGEFRDAAAMLEEKYSIEITSNEQFMAAYLAFHKQKLRDAIGNSDNFFLTTKEDKNGLYDTIFNADTTFDDMLCSLIMFNLEMQGLPKNMLELDDVDEIVDTALFVIGLSKEVLENYLSQKYPSDKQIDINIFIKKADTNITTKNILRKVLKQVELLITKHFKKTNLLLARNELKEQMIVHVNYERLKETIRSMRISVKDIENIVLEEK